jgi:hypothetical protein
LPEARRGGACRRSLAARAEELNRHSPEPARFTEAVRFQAWLDVKAVLAGRGSLKGLSWLTHFGRDLRRHLPADPVFYEGRGRISLALERYRQRAYVAALPANWRGSRPSARSWLLDRERRIPARDRFAPDSPLEERGFELVVPL